MGWVEEFGAEIAGGGVLLDPFMTRCFAGAISIRPFMPLMEIVHLRGQAHAWDSTTGREASVSGRFWFFCRK